MKISLCSTCMNRLKYLKQTIHTNLDYITEFNDKNNDQYELVLCNYDSKDGLHDYIMSNFQKEIKSGVLNYIQIENKEFFHVMHAKNIAYRYSLGEVLINLDADNFVSYEILELFSKAFNENDMHSIYLADTKNIGLLGFSRDNFYKLGGYDESMEGYGEEDIDLRLRAFSLLNLKQVKPLCHINHLEDYVIHQTPSEKSYNHKYSGDKTIENGSTLTEKFLDMIKRNIEIRNKNIFNKILNPNKFNKIEFGKI